MVSLAMASLVIGITTPYFERAVQQSVASTFGQLNSGQCVAIGDATNGNVAAAIGLNAGARDTLKQNLLGTGDAGARSNGSTTT